MNNKIGKALKLIAIFTFVVGFIGGITVGEGYLWFNWGVAFAVWAGAFISGISLLGFAEIISLLQKLVNKE